MNSFPGSCLAHILLWTVLVVTIWGCTSTDPTRETYIEAQPSFFELRHGDLTQNTWIRQPEHLQMLHETFKKIGYRNLLNTGDLRENPFIANDVYINRPLHHLLDSLEMTYPLDTIPEKYYREFWARRKAEHNDRIVYAIIQDINASLKNASSPGFKPALVNDTLYQLTYIQYRKDTLTPSIATDNFLRLRNLGFHQSAYNLLFETYRYYDIQWNTDSLAQTLTPSTRFTYPWFEDDTK